MFRFVLAAETDPPVGDVVSQPLEDRDELRLVEEVNLEGNEANIDASNSLRRAFEPRNT